MMVEYKQWFNNGGPSPGFSNPSATFGNLILPGFVYSVGNPSIRQKYGNSALQIEKRKRKNEPAMYYIKSTKFISIYIIEYFLPTQQKWSNLKLYVFENKN